LAQFAPDEGNETLWSEIPPREPQRRSSQSLKLAILFFVKDAVFNAGVWLAWMKQALTQRLPFKVLVHASGMEHGYRFHTESFRRFLVNTTAHTSWGDIAEAEMLLIRMALEDAEVTHLATVSADTLPFKPLQYIYAQLLRDPATRMCVDLQSWENLRGTHAETWWLMRRADAELFRDNWDMVRYNFKRRSTEEKTWLYPLLLRKYRWGDQQPLTDECVMYTDWTESCNHWADHGHLCNCPELLAEPHEPSSEADPAVFHRVQQRSWQELLKSPFWWGRKFEDRALKVGNRTFGADLVSS
jgi:hypothetical protein